jgi:hypothetical protein
MENRYGVTTENGPGGTTFRYYVTAHAEGEVKGRYPYAGETAEFDIEFLPGTTMKLSFEQGDDGIAPIDSSRFNYLVDVIGDTTFHGEAIDGTWSYQLGPNNDLAAMDAPATSSFDVTASLWFKATSAPSNQARLLAHENAGDSSSVNYSLYFMNGSLHAKGTGAGDVELSDHQIETGKWYRAVYMISESAHSLQLWNRSGKLVTHDVEEINGLPAKDQDGTLYIGQGNFHQDSAFSGLVDKVEIINYPAESGPFIAQNVTQYVSVPDTIPEYPIEVDIPHAGEGTVNARLHYRGQFGWTFLEMDKQEGSSWYSKPITQQDGKTSVPYFVTVEEGPYSATLPAGATASDTTNNYRFGVYSLYTKVLDIDFEEYVADTSAVIPVDQSTYSEFNDVGVTSAAGPYNMPVKSNDAAEGKHSFSFTRQDSSFVEVSSDFLSTDEVTINFWFKPTSFNFTTGWKYYKTSLLVTKNNQDINCHFGWCDRIVPADAYYKVGINNSEYGGDGPTLNGSTINEGFYDPSVDHSERTMHDALVMDSVLSTGNWYQVHFEYSKNDTAFTKLMDGQGNLIEAVGMEADGFGSILKNDMPLTIGNHFIGPGPQGTFYGLEKLYSGLIDDVEIYNYATTTKPPQISGLTDHDSISTNADPQSVSATVTRNGDEPVYLVWRVHSSSGVTAWDSTAMEADFTGSNYSGELPTQDAGTAVEYFVSTQNDFGVTASSDTERAIFHRDQPGETLVLDFESGEGKVMDNSPYNWHIKRRGKLASTPRFTRDAIKGKYALEIHDGDSTYLAIDAPYPFLNHSNMTVSLWFKNYDGDDNSSIRLLGKPSTDADEGSWWRQNFELKGIGGGSWTAGGYLPDTTLDTGSRYIVNHLDGENHYGGQEVKDALKDSTWYRFEYVQDVDRDSIHTFISTADGTTIAQSTIEIPGDMNLAPVSTHGPFVIGHAGVEGQGFFHGVIDHVQVRSDVPEEFGVKAERPGSDLPDKFSLGDNYPNPFNPTTTIEYALPKSTDVTLTVYNLLGREVATLVNSKQKAGNHQVKFDAGSLASGVYFYRIETPEFNKVRKMMLIK